MKIPSNRFKTLFIIPAVIVLSFSNVITAQDKPADSAPPSAEAIAQAGKVFLENADKALATMKTRAEELHSKGVALVAYVPGDKTESWTSKMVVVGNLKDPKNNLLAFAYSKASEMADTLKPSGSGVRPPLKGEFGFQGGWIVPCKTGHIIAAFSGGRSEDDVEIAKTGAAALAQVL